MRLPQGPWFPWSREFRWDRFPWQGAKSHERQSVRDQRDLAALVEAAATTIGLVAREAGFSFRPDACRVDAGRDDREVHVLYEAAADSIDGHIGVQDGEHSSCVDLWIVWSPETEQLKVNLPGTLRSPPAAPAARDNLRSALQTQARAVSEQLT